MVRAALYCRISQDRDDERLGVARQEADCRDLCDRLGWDVVQVFTDNDLSAFSGQTRPAYERLLQAVEQRAVDAVVAWHPDRLYRRMTDLERLVTVVESSKVQVKTVTAGDVDLSTASGRHVARILGSTAQAESERKSERIRRQREQLAQHGRPHPGPRPFGYEPGGLVVRESEATLVRDAAHRVLAGESMRGVALRWNELGVLTARGNRWSTGAVVDLLTSPRIAGLRQHRDAVVGEGAWPAIISREDHERLTALAARRRGKVGRPPRLLTGLATCGRCGHGLVASRQHGVAVYACRRQPGTRQDACGALSVVADPLEDLVRDALLTALSGPLLADLLGRVAQDDGPAVAAARDVADLEQRLDALTEAHFIEGVIDRGRYLRAKAELGERLDAARRVIGRAPGPGVLAGLPAGPDALRSRWDAESVEWRRALLEAVVERIVLMPAPREAPRRFDPGRVRIEWRA